MLDTTIDYSCGKTRSNAVGNTIKNLAVLFLGWVVVSLAGISVPIAGLSAQEKTPAESSDLTTRLAKLDGLIEEQRVKNKIPGLAIGIVKDGKVIFAKGYGLSDIDAKKAVDVETLFAIGSSTKSFTSTLVAMMVDEGKMSFDDPVTKFIPDFKMNVDTGDKEITIRDLLCHRTGFTRMGILWASGGLNRTQVIKEAAKAEAYADFQESFLYNNVMYMTAGICAGISAGGDWDSLVADKIFKPLGMTNSSTSLDALADDPRTSKGYVWDSDKDEFTLLPMRRLDSIGPSGSINSNINDMTKWLQFQLANGSHEGQQLLSEKSQGETWTKQIEIAGGIDYGMGWMLQRWNGKKVVEHGGNIDGFSAQVTLLPELNAGYVLFANVSATPLQGSSISLVFDTLFGEESDEGADNGAEPKGLDEIDTSELVGKYIANFGPFNDGVMEVKMHEGSLAIDVPGQTVYALKSPDKDGKWFFELTNTIAISFNKSDDGKVRSVTMYQGGMEPEFLREDVEHELDSPSAVTNPLVGKYRDERNEVDVEIEVKQGRLVVEIGDGGTFSFLPPSDKNDKWTMQPKPGLIQLQFNRNDDGTVKSVTRFQGDDEVEMKRISEHVESDLPSVDELLANISKGCGLKDEYEFAGIRLTGTSKFVHQGAEGTVESDFSMHGQHSTRQDFGKMAVMTEAYDGENGYSYSNVSRYEVLAGKKLRMLRLRHPLWFALDWKSDYSDVEITGEDEVDGEKTIVLTFSGDDISDRELHVSAESGLILKEKASIPNDMIGEIPMEYTYSDFREVGGIMLPFKTSTENPMMGKLVVQYESSTVLKEFEDGAFVVEPPDNNR